MTLEVEERRDGLSRLLESRVFFCLKINNVGSEWITTYSYNIIYREKLIHLKVLIAPISFHCESTKKK